MNEHVPPAASEPSTADELRDDIEKTRDELAASVDALSSKLDVKAQSRRKLRDIGRAVGRTKQKAPAPIQKAADTAGMLVHRAVERLAPPARQFGQKAKAHRKQLSAAAGLAILSVVIRRRRGDRDS
jgi:hypothetical protein